MTSVKPFPDAVTSPESRIANLNGESANKKTLTLSVHHANTKKPL